MIGRLRGTVAEISGANALIDVQGVGYELLCSLGLISSLSVGSTATITVFTDVREDSIRLFGFADQLERQVFDLLLKVKGVGTKIAMQIISGSDKRELLRAIGSGDAAQLQAVKGVGRKTSERIILELRDKVGEFALDLHPTAPGRSGASTTVLDDATEALIALGFTRADAEKAVKQAQKGSVPLPDAGAIVKEALRFV